jgi:RimJ/RimL family protein N-acetyltransferase
VLEDRESGSFLGDCGLTYQPVEGQPLLEIGYHLTARHRGKGYATEAGAACISYSFDVLKAPIVCSIVDPENTDSLAVASRLHQFDRNFINDKGQEMRLFWSPRPS